MRMNVVKVMMGLLVAVVFGMAGCGSGGGGDTPVAKTSAIDGVWKHSPTENENTLTNLHLLKDVTFSNGNVSAIDVEPSGCAATDFACMAAYALHPRYRSRAGQFIIAGNTLTLKDIIINDDPSWGKFTSTCNFTVGNGVLVLTDSSGTATFTKQP